MIKMEGIKWEAWEGGIKIKGSKDRDRSGEDEGGKIEMQGSRSKNRSLIEYIWF